MNRLIKILLISSATLLASLSYSQSNSDSLIFVKFNTVYRSNLIDFSLPDLLMLKFKTIPKGFKYDQIFCDLTEGKFHSKALGDICNNAILDSLNKMFWVFKVEFEKSEDGHHADSILNSFNNYKTGYLIPLQKDNGSVTNYIAQRFTLRFESVRYQITKLDCDENNQCCVAIVKSIK